MQTQAPPSPAQKQAFDDIAATIRLTGGLTLSQLAEISGLETSTIQNWVKRGWVEAPKNRRYGETSAARTLIIAMLRGAMQLSGIVDLMSYVNGRVDDRSDDAIPDAMLYNILCSITSRLENIHTFDIENIDKMIAEETKDYKEPFSGGKEKLFNTLKVMTLAYFSSELKSRAEKLFNSILKENN